MSPTRPWRSSVNAQEGVAEGRERGYRGNTKRRPADALRAQRAPGTRGTCQQLFLGSRARSMEKLPIEPEEARRKATLAGVGARDLWDPGRRSRAMWPRAPLRDRACRSGQRSKGARRPHRVPEELVLSVVTEPEPKSWCSAASRSAGAPHEIVDTPGTGIGSLGGSSLRARATRVWRRTGRE